MQSIKYKILTAFVIVITVLVISEAVFVGMHFVIVQRYQDITNNMISEYQVIEDTTNLINSFNDMVKYVDYKERLDAYNSNRAALINLLSRLDRTITNPDSQIAYLGLKNTVNTVITDCDNGVNSVSQSNFNDVTNDYTDANHQNVFVQQDTANLILKELQYTEKLQAEIARNQMIGELAAILLFIFVLLGCNWYTISFSRRLVVPLAKLTKLAKVIEGGSLDTDVEPDLLKGSDEVASLANSFNSMINSLKANIRQLREYNEALVKTKKVVIDRETRINQLQEINRMKDEFMNIVTHELKTPLIPIVGLSEIMGQKKEVLPLEFQGYVDIIHEEAQKITNLIRQILTATRSKTVGKEVPKDTFKLDEFVLSQDLPLKEIVKRTNSKIEFKILNKDIQITSDKDKISQVIFNLVDNAVKYGSAGQMITITVSQPDDKSAKVEITDQGKGIPADMQDMLFLKFSQLEPSASRSREGMGLGLYICKQNIEFLGGDIGVKSEVGHGSTFYFTLPLVYSEKAEKIEPAAEEKADQQPKKPAKSKRSQTPKQSAAGQVSKKK
jgi:signal transduction histidine kinase